MRIFITGVSSGIGRELARVLVAAGREVRGVARRADAMASLAAEIGSPAFAYDVCDIADPASMATLSQAMKRQDYVPDVVILNAAVDLDDEYPGLDFGQSCQMMRTNVDGAYFWVAAFIEAFVERNAGQFVAVSSIFAHWPDRNSVSYSGSKAGLSMLMRGLRIRYAATRLQFKLLYLGPVDTPINPRFSAQEPSGSAIVASATGTAEFIVRMLGSNRRNFYFPFYIFLVFTFLRWLPDTWFEFLTSPFKR
ncbi:MAG: SDR family NAD(P)-dependent oxidoreductase [Halioglobus sp.]